MRNKVAGRGYPATIGFKISLRNLSDDVLSAEYAFEVKSLKNHGFEVQREQCIVTRTDQNRDFFDRSSTGFKSNIEGIKPALDPASLALPIVAGEPRFAPVSRALAGMRTYAIDPGKLREMQDPDSGLNLKSDGGNVASVLEEINRQAPEDVARIGELLASIVPHIAKVYPKKHGNKLSMKFTQEWGQNNRLDFDAFNMSDGTLRTLGLLVAVYQRQTPSLIVIEEPEMTMHPGAFGAILDLIRHAARKMQVIVTTHSPDLLDSEWLEDRHIRLLRWEEGATHLSPLSSGSRAALQNHLMSAGELLRSNALRGESIASESTLPPLFEEIGS